MDVPAEPSSAAPVTARWPGRRDALVGTLALTIGGAATGAIDAVWGWSAAGQLAPGVGARLRLVVYLITSYALLAAVAGAVLMIALQLGRFGTLWRFAQRDHAAVRAAAPERAVIGLSMSIVGPPLLLGALLLAHHVLVRALAGRQDPSLSIMVAIVVALGAAAAAVGAAFVLARPVELGLTALSRRAGGKVAAALSSLRAPQVALLAWALIIGVGAWRWSLARKVDISPALAGGVVIILAVGARPPARRLADRLSARRWRARVAIVAGALVATLAIMLLAGHDPAVVAAGDRHSALGGPIARVVRRPLDLDRDGFSPLLGGGDCDDGDASISPRAYDVPGDGIDQNCAGGDADPAVVMAPHDLAFAPVPASVPADANIVLITIDTLRADHLGAYGYGRPTSPTIDALAAGGTRFANAWAHAPSTRYSMPALLTGRYPLSVRYDHSIDGWPGLLPRATTIAEGLAARGLKTGAFTNYWYFDEVRRMNQGFEIYDNKNKRLHSATGDEGPKHTRGSSSKEQTDKALEFVAQHAAERFFLWVHYYDPHSEYEQHPEVARFGDSPLDRYDAEIRFTDFHLARLIDDLKARGLYDKTIFVVTGDHGEGFGEHGIELHGYHLYPAQTRVPLIIRVPGLAPRVALTPAGHVDVMPTLLNLAGAAATDDTTRDLEGRSLVDVLAGAPDLDRSVFQQLSYEGNHEMRAAASQHCQVIYNISPTMSWEAYRVDQDPLGGELVDPDGPPCASTKRALLEWLDRSQLPPDALAALLPAAPAIAAPLGVRFGAEVELLSVELPASAKAGELISITWTFAAHGQLTGGWKVFAHFESGRGGTFRGDHEPARPLSWWREGQYIRYTTDLTIPRGTAAGRYQLWTGVWKGKQRRPARAGAAGTPIVDNRANVGSIEVTR